MRISTITNWAYGVTVGLTLLAGGAFILSARSADFERRAVVESQVFNELSEQLAMAAEQTSEDARLFVMRGEDRHLQAFRGDEKGERDREQAIKSLKSAALSSREAALIQEVEQDGEALDALEERAVAAYTGGDQEGARQTLFGPEHERIQGDLLTSVRQFTDLVATRTSDALAEAKEWSDFWGAVAKSLLGLTAAVFLGVLYFVLRRRVAMPLMRMTGIVNRLAKQDYAVEVLPDSRRDEIGEMNDAIQIFRDNGLERERLDAERREDQRTKDLILQMMHRLQACQRQEELAEVVSLFAPQIFPNFAGHLYVMNDSRTALSSIGSWREPRRAGPALTSAECWALRRGRPHVSDAAAGDIPCQHLSHAEEMGICVPLSAQGDTVGLLYFEGASDGQAIAAARLYFELIAENIGLGVANLQLRDRLMGLAIRDGLTGLLNRRSLDEALNRIARDGAGDAIAIMADIDHFKRFNDEFGHDAGDEVMRRVSAILSGAVGDAGIVYRFGGEEFAILLTGASEDSALDLAEKLRTLIAATPVTYHGRLLGAVTISVGAASTARDAPSADLLLRADAALLNAKSKGRNRTIADWVERAASDRRRAV
ncbi:sensor domain-containing diguanylate cyclase [Rhizobium sp. BE258]|uniref:sensor domain-containing diguanylate cyclase n=1 Tax=Rhizobium sp. BE258 TaxID=2817722 RepID=UPI0028603DD7|nr:sensor domain-containing diguanylate cyclase [Rhizobium sp. BE258]MDR7142444.1 diguanylate cyclase (GGDEF)-like protein [Rhizobium sp. BE258]